MGRNKVDLGVFDGFELARLFEVYTRVLNDAANVSRVPIHAVYCMSHTPAYDRVILDGAISRISTIAESAQVLYCGEEPASGMYHGEERRRYLKEQGVVDEDLVPILGSRYWDSEGQVFRVNSFTEARPVLSYMVEQGLTNLEIVTLPFHIVRCFIGFVTEILNMGLAINVFPRVTRNISFIEESSHSQGTQMGTAAQFAQEEVFKILSYKNLCKPSEVTRYLDERDARSG